MLKLVIGCVEGDVENVKLEWNDGYVACVNLVSDGYPGAIQTGFPIEGLEDAKRLPGVRIFHAGTRMRKGRLETAGGRVLNVTAVGATLQEAIARAYEAVAYIHFHGMDYRRDIGSRVLQAISRLNAQLFQQRIYTKQYKCYDKQRHPDRLMTQRFN